MSAAATRFSYKKSISMLVRSISNVTPVTRPESINHCSNLIEHGSFETECRVLLIQKTLKHLQNNQIEINSDKVKGVYINDCYESKGTNGASLFLYEYVPQLKFKYPAINFQCERNPTEPWTLDILYKDGTVHNLTTHLKSSKDILEEFALLVTKM